MKRKSFIAIASSLVLTLCPLAPQAQQSEATPASSVHGREVFASNCAACHGLDGKGTERAPNVADGANVRRLSNSQIFSVIQDGIPAAGMPSFHSLATSDIEAIVKYLRRLAGTNEEGKVPGDPIAGKTLFYGKATCSRCHMAAGKGGFIASDLSQYVQVHSPEEIRDAIVNPKDSPALHMRLVTITLSGGRTYVGRVRNEDNFSIQLQTLAGTFLFVSKSNIEKLDYDSKLLMPVDYGSILTSDELKDIVSYLAIAAGTNSAPAANFDDD